MKTSQHHTKQRGATLIESMVAILLMSVGMLGAVALQATTQKEQRAAHYSGMAAQIATELSERMRSNRLALLNNNYIDANNYDAANALVEAYTGAAGATALQALLNSCTAAAACTDPSAIASYDLGMTRFNLAKNMPSAALTVRAVTSNNTSSGIPLPLARDIVIAWREPTLGKRLVGNNGVLVEAPVSTAESGCTGLYAPSFGQDAGIRCYIFRLIL